MQDNNGGAQLVSPRKENMKRIKTWFHFDYFLTDVMTSLLQQSQPERALFDPSRVSLSVGVLISDGDIESNWNGT